MLTPILVAEETGCRWLVSIVRPEARSTMQPSESHSAAAVSAVNPATPIVVLEFNELNSDLIHRFMGLGLLPGFRELYERSTVFATEAGEPSASLEPWIQWPSVHSGMPYARHQVFHLGDAHKVREKFVAEILSDTGTRVGVFGSMNTNYRQLNGYFMPDPWHKLGQGVSRVSPAVLRASSRGRFRSHRGMTPSPGRRWLRWDGSCCAMV